MSNIFTLLDNAEARIQISDPEFHDKADHIMQVLKCSGVLSTKRATQNGAIHKRLAAELAIAHEDNETVDVSTRRCGTIHERGHSTVLMKYLDKAVTAKLLVSKTSKAMGKLTLGLSLTRHLG